MRNKKMFYSSLRYGFMLIALMCLTSFYACLGKDEPKQPKDNEKEYWQGTIDDIHPYENSIFVILSKEASFNFKGYTSEDFLSDQWIASRINGVLELSFERSIYQVMEQLEAEKTGDYSGLQRHIDAGTIFDLDKFRRVLWVGFNDRAMIDGSRARFIYEAVRTLEKREDFIAVFPSLRNIQYGGLSRDYNRRVIGYPYEIPNIVTVSGSFKGLDTETEKNIRQAYADRYNNSITNPNVELSTLDDWIIDLYLGAYNGCFVIGNYSLSLARWEGIIAGMFFMGTWDSNIEVWRDGRFYELQEAYDLDFLTLEDVRNIAYFWHNNRELNLENHPGLLSQIRRAIRDIYYEFYLKPSVPQAVLNDVQIERYYGSFSYIDAYFNPAQYHGLFSEKFKYNACAAVMIKTKYDNYDNTPWEETAAGTLFRYNNGNRILLWKIIEANPTNERNLNIIQSNFYTLQEAYDLGFLKKEDIESISYYHESNKWISYIIE